MNFNRWLNIIADGGRDLLGGLIPREENPIAQITQLCEALISSRGDAMGTALAREVSDAYLALDNEGRAAFFQLLIERYSPDPEAIATAAQQYASEPQFATYQQLTKAVEAPRQDLFRRINMAPYGTETLVSMRTDLLTAIDSDASLGMIETDLHHLLTSWFNRGFLELRKIDWTTPANILEKIMSYESVHEMSGWSDLRRRLAEDRRCYAFFHPTLAYEPLIFVEVALVNELPAVIGTLLESPEQSINKNIDTAVFYSINNCQAGLAGITFGNFLIKQVATELKIEMPQLTKYATLSPIPGFARYLQQLIDSDARGDLDLEEVEMIALQNPHWHQDEALVETLSKVLPRLCAHYLVNEKRADDALAPLDPVARFHLRNGASIERLNWMGDNSDNAVRQSYGMLVNYSYEFDSVESNHEKFVNEGKVACSRAISKLIN